MKFDKDITKIKRVTFFLRHSVDPPSDYTHNRRLLSSLSTVNPIALSRYSVCHPTEGTVQWVHVCVSDCPRLNGDCYVKCLADPYMPTLDHCQCLRGWRKSVRGAACRGQLRSHYWSKSKS